MADPKKASAERAAVRRPRWIRFLGWALAVAAWAVASEARPLLALLSVVATAAIRGVYVITTGWGKGRSVFASSWFFAVAALCEIVWLAVTR
jgi:flavin reductase (DIM6/NTAB) family NADH-FMN oxidoreductase RutF